MAPPEPMVQGRKAVHPWATPLLPDTTDTLLLQACLLDAAAAQQAWRDFAAQVGDHQHYFEKEWQGRKGLLPFMSHALSANGVALDADFKAYIRVAQLREELRSDIYFDVLADLAGRLADLQPQPLLLKGAAYSRTLYPEPKIRHNHAIDLLIDPTQHAHVTAALLDLGLRDDLDGTFRHGNGLPVRVHTSLFAHPGLPQGIAWDDLSLCAVTGTPWRTLTPTGHLVHALMSGMLSPNRQNLRWLVDAVLLLRSDAINPGELHNLVAALNLNDVAAVVLDYLHRHFEVSAGGVQIDSGTVRRGLMDQFSFLLTAGVGHREIWNRLSTPAQRAAFVLFSLLPPRSYVAWQRRNASFMTYVRWHVSRPWRLLNRTSSWRRSRV